MNYLRNIGKSIMLPIAVLPAAAILAGIGNWLLSLGIFLTFANILTLSGTAILDNLGILFAIGIAFGMTRDKNGAATLPAVVMLFIVFRLLNVDSLVTLLGLNVTDSQAPIDVLSNSIGSAQALSFTKLNNAFIGILIGVISSILYNKFSGVELPKALSFFSGRRLVPIIASIVAVLLSFVLFILWPILFYCLTVFGETVQGLGAVGAGIYGFSNRLLIPTGLHHALNSVFWFDVAGINDIGNFLGCSVQNFDATTGVCMVGNNLDVAAKVGQTGMYQAGFFPIMMFGLPAGALAIYHTALPENKVKVGSIMLAGAFASFFTGVTEPLEFSFMFVAWPLYIVHAVLTGLSLFIAASLGYINGFGFSAGLVDFVLNFNNPLSQNAIMLIVQGIIFALLYYFIFRFFIVKFNLLTPGRTKGEFDDEDSDYESLSTKEKYKVTAQKIYEIIGEDNLVEVDNCATRLRLKVKDSEKIDETAIKRLEIVNVVKPTKDSIQIIIGPTVEFVANELKKISNK